MTSTRPDPAGTDAGTRPRPHRPAAQPNSGTPEAATPEATGGVRRRGFLGWVIAAPTLMVGAPLVAGTAGGAAPAAAAIPNPPELADTYDLGDLQDDAALPTSHLITVVVHDDGTATFALPRAEVGQGITTSTAMIIAEQLDIPVSKVTVTLAKARPELLFNQLTGGSNTTRSTYQAISDAAALAKAKLVEAAAKKWGLDVSALTTRDGAVHGPGGRSAGYGDLTRAAAASKLTRLQVTPKAADEFTVLGKPHKRVDALAAVTGKKVYAMDMHVAGAMPTMIARAPTINGTPVKLLNRAEVLKMPGVKGVAKISTGVAVRAETFGQCIDAIRKVEATWTKGTEAGKSDASVLAELRAAEIPLAVPDVPIGATSVDGDFVFHFRSNSPLETGTAVASYEKDRIQVWSCLKVPIVLQEQLASTYGMAVNQVEVHVVQGGGSFGRHLFSDAALEAVEASKALGAPVKLMWSRTDDFRQGRTHPMATSRVRATYLAGNVLTYEQRHTSVSTDFTHGLGEILTALSAKLPAGNFTFAQSIFELTQTVSYEYGVTTQLLDEVDMGFNTGSMRNIYSPDARTAQELITDKLARLAGKDPYEFRKEFVKDPRGLAVLNKVAEVGKWGRTMPAHTAQGIAVHNEYKGWCAALVEIDCRPATRSRKVADAYTGPRVTKVVFAVDVGMTLNPTGLEAQMQGGIMDGIAQTLTSSLHLKDGYFLEGSWDNYFYTREWNVPPHIEVIVMPDTSTSPGGAGEFGVAATMAATACAYGRATGTMPKSFPINHTDAVKHFDVIPTHPSTPQSPTDGLEYRY
ncbi:molybdopterin cofactor-binding domain-containing protein [Jatrophihabitans endophyticus]|uniref:molybdopterin cofactor-binding domain-containing protein n=1 Tax=Jatrophihabitans endophyticus TaxID=1206085 RepID=UPI0019E11957|nr:molybdopterin cofactor-binding domain-containing protein [Jatrophihabitans endophyticus]MBE7189379.1 xanthine dehydrogenase family protein molybdopterin-binding subunit [Jatrophihabitans endophyticus]